MDAAPRAGLLRRLAHNPSGALGGGVLALLLLAAFFGGFVAPYPEGSSDRARIYQPPDRLHWRDPGGHFHLVPFVHPLRAVPGRFRYEEDRSRLLPMRFLARGEAWRFFGITSDRHLFAVDAPERVYLLGADGFGRDVLSRLVFGAQVSLTVGLLGILVSFSIGLLLGGISGYLGGWVDAVLMRFTELLLSIPALYLIVGLRSIFPDELPSRQVYLGIVAILALIGWASLARVIRGLVLSIRASDFVLAAEALGLSRGRILVRHVLPGTLSFAIVAATLAVPGYILGEVVLSFLGVGIQEPNASWGNMLQQARSLGTLTSFPWLLYAPGAAIFVTVMSCNLLGDALRDALDPRDARRRPA